MRIAVILMLGLLSACSTLEAPKEALVALPVQCYDRMPDKPNIATDADLAAMPDYALVLRMAKDRLTAIGYIADLEAKLLGCVHPAPATSQP